MRVAKVMTLVLALVAGPAQADATRSISDVMIEQAVDLRAEGRTAQQNGVALLLMVSSDNCPYCERMKQDFLKPMIFTGDYDQKVVIRRIEMGERTLIDFEGKRVSINEFARRYGVFVTPTLLFLDHKGHQLTEKMVGLGTPDFFGGYLDAAIDDAVDRLRGSRSVAARPGSCTQC